MSASAIDRVKELLAAAIEDDDGLMRLLPYAIPILEELVTSQEALREVTCSINLASHDYAACDHPPCDLACEAALIARDALRLEKLTKAMKR